MGIMLVFYKIVKVIQNYSHIVGTQYYIVYYWVCVYVLGEAGYYRICNEIEF